MDNIVSALIAIAMMDDTPQGGSMPWKYYHQTTSRFVQCQPHRRAIYWGVRLPSPAQGLSNAVFLDSARAHVCVALCRAAPFRRNGNDAMAIFDLEPHTAALRGLDTFQCVLVDAFAVWKRTACLNASPRTLNIPRVSCSLPLPAASAR